MLSWQQIRTVPLSRLTRAQLAVPLAVSVLLHGVLLAVIIVFRLGLTERTTRLADSAADTTLELPLSPVPQPTSTPPPEAAAEAPPEPEEPEPEAAAPPVAAEMMTPATVEVIPQLPAPLEGDAAPTPAAPAPAAEPVVVEPSITTPSRVSFAGVEGSPAQRIVYVVDASGSMTSSLRFVKEELVRSIARLQPTQAFQIIIVHGTPDAPGAGEVEVFQKGSPTPATGDTRLRAATWLESAQPRGSSDPLAGLSAALHLKPDLIFLLTRSIRRSGTHTEWGKGASATLAELDRLNPVSRETGQRPAVIKTIQFIDDDPTGLLKDIAQLHGDGAGSYKVLRLEELK